LKPIALSFTLWAFSGNVVSTLTLWTGADMGDDYVSVPFRAARAE
jgi:hypothetical protein